ncbi:hydrolase [Ilyonectria robusta]|uniref:hydrolase n=1 Tax=Ilyonectria robusta TaxID=1079257 RepID=UPI001E8E746A|nr:hydrolase [Ilyonectria robusta]KAH8670712.1 hydrolase [Ilyonectria robusta]
MSPTLKSTLLGAVLCAASTQAFQNPIRNPGPDPSLVFADGNYHLTYTSYDRIQITRSATLGGLISGETKVIWTDTNTTRNANMWAPELHQIDQVWHMFYSSCNSKLSCCDSCNTRVLRGCDAAGPFDCEYTHLADLVPPEGHRGGPDNNFGFSIDGTYLEVPSWGSYHVLSIDNEDHVQSLAITKLDKSTWTVEGWHVISVPDQPWEYNTTGTDASLNKPVNEAPHPLYHGDDIWLSFSASYCGTPNYSLGLLHWNGGDPLEASSWNKTGPVFAQANGNYGTGHNSFFTSPDGTEIWNAFHATQQARGSCGRDRYTMAQIVTFDETNTPDFGVPQPFSATLTPPSGE